MDYKKLTKKLISKIREMEDEIYFLEDSLTRCSSHRQHEREDAQYALESQQSYIDGLEYELQNR